MSIDHASEQHAPDGLLEMSAAELGRALRDGTLSPVELTEAALQRIEALDGQVRAFVTVTRERALSDARQAERDLRAGHDRGPLLGIPLALKDLVATRGIRTTASSQVLADNIPDENAAVAERLTEGGMALLGKTNTHEFATRSSASPDCSTLRWRLERALSREWPRLRILAKERRSNVSSLTISSVPPAWTKVSTKRGE